MSTCEVASAAPQPVAELAHAVVTPPQADPASGPALPAVPTTAALALAGLALAAYLLKRVFDTPSRTYDQNVGNEYDAWTEEGVLECECTESRHAAPGWCVRLITSGPTSGPYLLYIAKVRNGVPGGGWLVCESGLETDG